jgi:acid phosphatase family membrane protein YuiD
MMEAQRFSEQRLRELIGHTPFEVFVGALLGALSAVSLR